MNHAATAATAAGAAIRRRVTIVRVVIIAVILIGWEALSLSGLLFRDVVPSLTSLRVSLQSRVIKSQSTKCDNRCVFLAQLQ